MTEDIDYSLLKKALKNLEMQHGLMKKLQDPQFVKIAHQLGCPEAFEEAVKESVVQRFEICIDLIWKILKKYLQLNLGLSDVPNAPKPILRIAVENKLLISDIDCWFNYIAVRNNTSHDYNGAKAQEALEVMHNFINDAIELYEKMSCESWEARKKLT